MTTPANKNKTVGHGRFDPHALYLALDQQRIARRMSWTELGQEIGVSPSTITRTRLGGRMEVDGMLAMVRWLGRTVESFTQGHTPPAAATYETAAKPGHADEVDPAATL